MLPIKILKWLEENMISERCEKKHVIQAIILAESLTEKRIERILFDFWADCIKNKRKFNWESYDKLKKRLDF